MTERKGVEKRNKGPLMRVDFPSVRTLPDFIAINLRLTPLPLIAFWVR